MLKRVAVAGFIAALAGAACAADKKPNIILFYVDDLGWMDTAFNGSEFYETPNMDRLAKEGVSFKQGYTAHPRCLPARYGVITGRFPSRDGVPVKNKKPVAPVVTMGEALKDGGYATCFVGKWHISNPLGKENGTPEARGFDVNIAGGHAGAPPTYFYPYRLKDISDLPAGWEKGTTTLALHGLDEGGVEGEYLTDRLTDESIRFIEDHADRPFFLYLSHYGVHTPFEAPERLVKKYEKKLKTMKFSGPEYTPIDTTGVGDQKMRQDNAVYAAMIESVDESLGRIFQTLEKLKIEDETVIVFTADNGGLSNRGAIDGKVSGRPLATCNLPLRTGKGWLYEGGIREVFVVKWPGVTASGTVNDTDMVVGTDLYPTFLDLAGLSLRPKDHVDGISLVPVLQGKPLKRDKPVFWNSGSGRPYSTGDFNASAVRIGDFKLIDWYTEDALELYDLSKDIGEQNNLAKKMPEKAAEMFRILDDWRAEAGIVKRPNKLKKR